MMTSNEYETMVEHLAGEIIDDVMEKEAAPRSKRIAGYEAAMKGPHNRKLIDATFDRTDSRIRRAALRDELKKAKANHDDDDDEIENIRAKLSKENRKKWGAIKTQLNPMNNLRANYEQLQHLTPSMLLPTAGNAYDAFTGKQKALRDIAAERAMKKMAAEYEDAIIGYAFEKEAQQDPTPRRRSWMTNFGKTLGPAGYSEKRTTKDILRDSGKLIKDHPVATGLTAAGTALAGCGAAALAKRKKKKEEDKEKVAAYYDDAMIKMAAAENVFGYADYHEDEYEALLLKNAAEEAYEDAMAQAEAAENVYDAIENDEIDTDYIDDAEYEDYE